MYIPLVKHSLCIGWWRVQVHWPVVGLVGHVLDPIVDIVGDAAVVWVIEDHQPGQQDRVLQPMHWQGHEVVAFTLVMQD